MILTRAEEVVVGRAVRAYHAVQHKTTKGVFQGVTPDQILEELHPTAVRWVELASLIIARAKGDPDPI